MHISMTTLQKMSDRSQSHGALQRFDAVEVLFLLSTFFATVELRLVGSFTIYDFLTVVVAALLVIGPRRIQMLPSDFMAPIFLFLLFALLSTFRAPEPMESMAQIAQFMFIFFIQLPVILTVVRSRAMLWGSMILLLSGALLVVILSMVMHQVQGAGRMLTFYSENPNRLGYPSAYLSPILLLTLLTVARRRRLRVLLPFYLPLFYALVWALAASGSRSSTVGVVVALFIFLMFHQGLQLNGQFLLRAVTTVIIIGGVGYLIYQTDYFPDTLLDRLTRTADLEESLVNDRERLAIAGLLAFEESPLIGIGLDNFRYVARTYLPEATPQLPHNLWIQFLAQIGLIGTLMFALLILGWYWLMWKAARNAPTAEQREEIWTLLAAFTAVQTIYLFLPIMIQRQYWLLYGLGLAIAIQILDQQTGQRPAVPTPEPAKSSPLSHRWGRSRG